MLFGIPLALICSSLKNKGDIADRSAKVATSVYLKQTIIWNRELHHEDFITLN